MGSRFAAATAAATAAITGTFIGFSASAGASTSAPSAMNSMVVLSRLNTPADGSPEVVIIVTIDDSCDNPLSGKVVELKTSPSNTVVTQPLSIDGSTPGVTNDSGVAEFAATDTAVEAVTFSAFDVTDGLTVDNQPTEHFQRYEKPPAATPEIATPALLPIPALAVVGIAYSFKRRRLRIIDRAAPH
jgi:hypothetical protein